MKCIEAVVTSACGADAAKIIRNLTEHYFMPVTEKMDCAPCECPRCKNRHNIVEVNS